MNILNNSHGKATRGGPPTCRMGEGLSTLLHEGQYSTVCYKTSRRVLMNANIWLA